MSSSVVPRSSGRSRTSTVVDPGGMAVLPSQPHVKTRRVETGLPDLCKYLLTQARMSVLAMSPWTRLAVSGARGPSERDRSATARPILDRSRNRPSRPDAADLRRCDAPRLPRGRRASASTRLVLGWNPGVGGCEIASAVRSGVADDRSKLDGIDLDAGHWRRTRRWYGLASLVFGLEHHE